MLQRGFCRRTALDRCPCVGTNARYFDNMLCAAREQALAQLSTHTVIYHPLGAEWRPIGNPRRRRPLDSVILDDGIAEKLVDDVKEFINNAQWYVVH